jgi:hypothetical protein
MSINDGACAGRSLSNIGRAHGCVRGARGVVIGWFGEERHQAKRSLATRAEVLASWPGADIPGCGRWTLVLSPYRAAHEGSPARPHRSSRAGRSRDRRRHHGARAHAVRLEPRDRADWVVAAEPGGAVHGAADGRPFFESISAETVGPQRSPPTCRIYITGTVIEPGLRGSRRRALAAAPARRTGDRTPAPRTC